MPMQVPVPAVVVVNGRYREPVPASDPATVPIRPSATIVLLRDTSAGLETFLLHRVESLAFAAGMSVFPGGAVEPGDRLAARAWSGPDPAFFAAAFGVDDGAAVVAAATRELFEETGVALVARPGAEVEPGLLPRELRADLLAQRITWPAALTAAGVRMRADLLKPWVRRITPLGRVRRYDTCFFVAELPAGQQADADTTEATSGGWMRPVDAVAADAAGRLQLMRPTRTVLTELAAYRATADVLGAPRPMPVGPTRR